eukprot:353872-Chlamydomonas_euryale.AAC.2
MGTCTADADTGLCRPTPSPGVRRAGATWLGYSPFLLAPRAAKSKSTYVIASCTLTHSRTH